ncbi:MAG: hypothetical protein IKX19_06140, partial [Clostridia bacterium]|nr:hypothetical protein [Clostridia bacterium]
MKRKRLSALFCLILLLVGCRKTPGVGAPPSGNGGTTAQELEETVLTNVYRGTVLNLPEEYGGTYAYKLTGTVPGVDRELGTVTVYAEDGEGGGHAVTWSPDSGIVSDVEVPIPEGQQYCAGAFAGDLFRYATAQIEGEPPVQDSVVLNIHCLNLETGEVTASSNLRPLFSTADSAQYGLWVSSLAVDADGDLWLATSEEVLVLSESFQRIASFTDFYNTPRRLTASPDGTVWLTNRDKICVFDKKNPSVPLTLSMPEKTLRVLFCGDPEAQDGEGFDFCYATETGVYGAKRTEGTVEPT